METLIYLNFNLNFMVKQRDPKPVMHIFVAPFECVWEREREREREREVGDLGLGICTKLKTIIPYRAIIKKLNTYKYNISNLVQPDPVLLLNGHVREDKSSTDVLRSKFFTSWESDTWHLSSTKDISRWENEWTKGDSRLSPIAQKCNTRQMPSVEGISR